MTVVAINAMTVEVGRLSGIGHYAVQLATWFARIGRETGANHRVIVLCRPPAAHHFEAIEGVETLCVPIGGGRIRRVLAEQFRLPALLRKAQVDALLNPAFTGPVRGARRIVTTVHDLYFRTVPELLPRAQRTFLSLAVPFCCSRSDQVVTTSASTKRDIARFYPHLVGKVRVVPMANRMRALETLPATAESSDGAAPFVLMVAALTGNKNPGPLVEAVARVRKRHPDVRLVHVGKDPDGLLARAVAELHADDWTDSRTGISDAQLEQLYQQCLCVAIPSLYEGFGLPVLEAQGFGAPVIASDRSSLPEVGGDGALYFDPTDSSAIAAAIDLLITAPERREALRRAGFANQARYSWKATAQGMLDILLGPIP